MLNKWHILVDEFQRKLIRESLYDSGGNVSAAAKDLGLPRTTLMHKMRVLEMGDAKSYAFNHDLDDRLEVERYFRMRAVQLAPYGFKMYRMFDFEMGVTAYFVKDSVQYMAFYLYKKYRGKKFYKGYIETMKIPVVTIKECGITDYLKRHNIPHIEVF